ncbi:MAG: hydantoinase/oxoprolinase family protein [Gaiellales bacterium]
MPRLAIDVGGTFVDIVLQHDDETVCFEKVLAEPDDIAGAVTRGLDRLLAAPEARAVVDEVIHATTRGSNIVLERAGPKTALVTTRGFRDVLQIQRALRWSMYDVQLDKPRPLVPRSLSFEVAERTLADGTLHTALDEAELEALGLRLRKLDVSAVAIAFLHSYANPTHERRAAEILRAALPGAVVTPSSDVSLQAREYERANTAVVNAYVATALSTYLEELLDSLPRAGVAAPLWVMQSSGGLASVKQATERPVRTLESGPAAGAIASAAFGLRVGHADVISFDMGGTTAKAAVATGGVAGLTTYFELERVENRRGSGLPVDIPAIDLVEVGTGGGSIAEIRDGRLCVGPRSAGAQPGPACYGRGGAQPTVTDANLLLGYYDPDVFAGGLRLDRQAATDAFGALASALGLGIVEAAWAVHEVATLDMEHAIRLVSINRGFDPRVHAFVCLGGAGPAHGPRLARSLGARVAIVPPAASGGSAQGLLLATESVELTRTHHLRLDDPAAETTCASLREALVGEARSSAYGARADGAVRVALGMRYVGQGYELRVPVAEDALTPSRLEQLFHDRYAQAYGYATDDQPVEVVTWQVSVAQHPARDTVVSSRDLRPPRRPDGMRPAYFPETGVADVPVHDRARLVEGDTLLGPCLVTETTTTTVVLRGDTVSVAADGSLLIEVGES